MAYITKKTTVNGVKPIGSNLFGTCSTASDAVQKVVTMADFDVLVSGVTIHVQFTHKNTASNPTLKVGSTSAVTILCNGASEGNWEDGAVISFTYNGTNWIQNDASEGGGVSDVQVNGTSVVTNNVANIVPSDLVDFFYPIGSYYETSDTSFDPNVAWGGTWVLETAGQVHVSAGTGYAIGSTGGSTTHHHSTGNHTLTVSQIPSHTHEIAQRSGSGAQFNGWHYEFTVNNSSGPVWNQNTNVNRSTSVIAYTGGGQAHNHGNTGDGSNMQPYVVVNRWDRTA